MVAKASAAVELGPPVVTIVGSVGFGPSGSWQGGQIVSTP